MKKILVMIFMAALLAVPLVAAEEVKIIVKAQPYHDIILRVLNPNQGNELKSFYGKTDVNGAAEFAYSPTFDELSFYVIERLFGETTNKQEFNNIFVESIITLEVDPTEEQVAVVAPVEETAAPANSAVETETLVDNATVELEATPEVELVTEPAETNSKITGFFISETTGQLTKYSYILIAAILGVFVIGIIVFRRYNKTEQTTFPMEESLEAQLRDAESKIKEANDEIRSIKSKRSDLVEAEKSFNRARDRLDRLKSQHSRIARRLSESQNMPSTDTEVVDLKATEVKTDTPKDVKDSNSLSPSG